MHSGIETHLLIVVGVVGVAAFSYCLVEVMDWVTTAIIERWRG